MRIKKEKRRAAGALWLAAFFFAFSAASFAAEGDGIKTLEENEITLYKDVFDQNFYGEAVNQLDLGRWGRKIFRKPVPSADINVFDEVPDSAFFTNRQGRQKLPPAELEKSSSGSEGPDLSRPLTVTAVEQRGLNYGFVVEDAKKDQYVLRFDPQNNLELNTGAEVVASRFYHAIGYNVPQYTVFFFRPEQLRISPDAITCDNSGFVKKLTQKTLDEYFSSIPQAPDGSYRASANKIPPGEELGSFSFWSRRKNDPQDPVNHRDRREIRALGIFAAWLNDYGLCESNTLDMSVTENGRTVLTHYLTDFTNALGAATGGAKPPMFGYEYMVDYGETFKTILALGLREKPWQKKWRDTEERPHPSPAVGYFSNKYFDPSKYKVQLPYEAFRIVTRADGFWAAKILMSFSDEDIRAMVKAGRYTDPGAADYVAKTLTERRDLIARHWFSRANPLDGFEYANGRLSFKDLAVEYGFEKKEGSAYSVEVLAAGEKKQRLAEFTVNGPELVIDPSWFGTGGRAEVLIRVLRPSLKKESPFVKVCLGPDGILGIRHED